MSDVQKCTSWLGHKFQPRYSLSAASERVLDSLADGNSAVAVQALLDRFRAKTYECDVCVRCGHVVERVFLEQFSDAEVALATPQGRER